jgi:hypothetical protein
MEPVPMSFGADVNLCMNLPLPGAYEGIWKQTLIGSDLDLDESIRCVVALRISLVCAGK